MKKIAVFPGSFDPYTKGHESIVEKALGLFDEIVIGIGDNLTKNYMFDLDTRIKHIQSIYENYDRVSVVVFQGLTVDFCKSIGAQYMIRGLRDTKDFEYERNIAQMNLKISGIESVFFMTVEEYASVSSTIIREIHKNGGNIDLFVTNAEKLV